MNKINGKELFGAGIRIVGLLSFGRGFVDLLYVLLFSFGLTKSSVNADFPYADFVYGLFYALGGLYLLRGAPVLINFAYSKNLDEPENKADSSASHNQDTTRN